MVYIKKKSEEILDYADFSMGLNDALKNYHYPLLGPEDVLRNKGEIRYF